VPPADTLDETKPPLAKNDIRGSNGKMMGRRSRSSAGASACNPTIPGQSDFKIRYLHAIDAPSPGNAGRARATTGVTWLKSARRLRALQAQLC
jgi:hypothetical protein